MMRAFCKWRRGKTAAFLIAALFVFVLLSVIAIRADDIEKNEHLHAKREAVERIRLGLENFEERINISDLSITPEELGRIFSDATKDSPYLFYVSSNLAYSYRTGGCVVEVKPRYLMERAEAIEAVAFCKGEIKKMADLLGNRESELERLVAAHDLICQGFAYDTTLESNNLHSFLKTGKGTCQGYTWTYMALLRELGIECRYVASDEIAHIWLAAKIEGEWYHSDVTWDDPPQKEGSGEYSRAHLLFSDEEADRDGYIDRYGSLDLKCNSKIYDGRELLSDVPFCASSGDVDHDGKVTLYDLLLLRMYLKKGSALSYDLCPVCADADGNHLIEEEDVEYIRSLLLGR